MNRGAQRIVIGVTAAAIVLLTSPHAFAFSREQLRLCESRAAVPRETRIAACTVVIGKTKAKRQKAAALTARGKAFRAKGADDRAILDFDQAIKIDSKNGEAYFNRGLTLRDRGEVDRALADLEQAVRYDRRNSVALTR